MAKDHASAIQHAEETIKHLLTSTEQWDHKFSGLEHLMPGARSQIYEYVKEHWAEDSFFGYQFLNGFNPMVIQRCSELPKNFPVTEEMVRDSMGGSTLEQEMKDGNIFLVDYRILDGLVGNVVHDEQTYLAAPLVLLYANPKGQMMPIAIQLTQEVTVPDACVKGELKQSPIFLPTDGKYDWLLAKTFVRLADSVHLMVTLWLRTYLLGEVFSMATLRNLPSTHPLYKLLIPNTRYNIA
ncbi:arachidonate 12-lipoxygenase, 12R-type-like, partial [Engraulis encrasicolus]|uniref:arachidonate 12-lipoxygenase, 12R-type-like n=1 Tax=Engraulis encrasicolus TaxID=184585 RepID=UPI002FCF34E1